MNGTTVRQLFAKYREPGIRMVMVSEIRHTSELPNQATFYTGRQVSCLAIHGNHCSRVAEDIVQLLCDSGFTVSELQLTLKDDVDVTCKEELTIKHKTPDGETTLEVFSHE